MKSEAELAGVLAHEIAHVLRKHHLKAIQKGAQTALAGDAVSRWRCAGPQRRRTARS